MKNIAIIGSGFVGKSTGKGFLRHRHNVIFSDINTGVLDELAAQGMRTSLPQDLPVEKIDIFMFTVPTLTVDGEVDLKHVESASKNLAELLKRKRGYFIAVMRSTVPPGTTENIPGKTIQKVTKKKPGKDFGLVMNPEYLRQATAEKDFSNPWIAVIGSNDKKAAKIIGSLYESFFCPIHYVSIREAETQKYVHNLWNASKISFFNEMREATRRIGINPDKIFEITMDSAEASWNKFYGIRDRGYFDGSCLPKDTLGFLTFARKELGFEMKILKSVIDVNEDLRKKVLQKKEMEEPVPEKRHIPEKKFAPTSNFLQYHKSI